MNRRMKFACGLLLSIFILVAVNAEAQTNYKLDNSKSNLKITGTSTLHDWHMVADQYNCIVKATQDDKQDISISSIDFKCQANSIKSDNSMMDDKAYEALKSDEFGEITFQSAAGSKIVVNGGTITGTLDGVLEIAGVKRNSKLPFTGEISTNGVINVNGEFALKMSTYQMKAPTALMGTIKTGDEITIHYNFYFIPGY